MCAKHLERQVQGMWIRNKKKWDQQIIKSIMDSECMAWEAAYQLNETVWTWEGNPAQGQLGRAVCHTVQRSRSGQNLSDFILENNWEERKEVVHALLSEVSRDVQNRSDIEEVLWFPAYFIYNTSFLRSQVILFCLIVFFRFVLDNWGSLSTKVFNVCICWLLHV